MDENIWKWIFGSGGLITLLGYILKNKETGRSASLVEIESLNERLNNEIQRMDERLNRAEQRAKEAGDYADQLEDEKDELIKENNWYQQRVENLEARVDELEKELEKERE